MQTGRDSFTMLAETGGMADHDAIQADMQRLMSAILNEKKLNYVCFSIRFVEHILPDPQTGKKRLIQRMSNRDEVYI